MGAIAKQVFQAVEYLSAICGQAQLLVDAIHGDFAVRSWAPDDWDEDPISDLSEWLSTGAILTRNVRRRGVRGKPGRIGSLTVMVDIGCAGGIASLAQQAVVVVAWGNDSNWNPEDFAVESQSSWKVLDGEKVVRWIGGDALDGRYPRLDAVKEVAWFYVVPLDAFAKRGDVGRLIAKPVEMLTTGRFDEAFADVPVLRLIKSSRRIAFSSN